MDLAPGSSSFGRSSRGSCSNGGDARGGGREAGRGALRQEGRWAAPARGETGLGAAGGPVGAGSGSRVRGEGGEASLRSYQALREADGAAEERLPRSVLYGLSCRNYERAALEVPGAPEHGKSSVSRAFVETSTARLRQFQERGLAGEDFLVLFVDGWSFAEDEIVVVLGVALVHPLPIFSLPWEG